MGVLFQQPTALRWFQAAGALPEPWVTWLCTQRFPAISSASLQLSYLCAKYHLLTEKVLLNVYDCRAIENWGSRGNIALSSWNPELWAMLMGVMWASRKCKGSRTAPSVVSKEQSELQDTLQVIWAVSEAISGLNTFTMQLFTYTSCLQSELKGFLFYFILF